MLEGITWHGIGVLCVLSIAALVRYIMKTLRGAPRKMKIYTLGIGIVSGIAGMAFTLIMILLFERIIFIEPGPGIAFMILGIEAMAIACLGTWMVSFVIGSWCKKISNPRAVMAVAFIVTAILTAQPVLYGWGKFVIGLFTA